MGGHESRSRDSYSLARLQCTRIITLHFIIIEICPFIRFLCPLCITLTFEELLTRNCMDRYISLGWSAGHMNHYCAPHNFGVMPLCLISIVNVCPGHYWNTLRALDSKLHSEKISLRTSAVPKRHDCVL